MGLKNFLLYFSLTIILSFLVVILFFKLEGSSFVLANSVIGFFSLFCIILYLFSNYSKQSKDLNLFTRIFLISVFLKIILFVFIILFAVRKLHISKKDIIIPSLIIYLLFTIFETYFLMKISNQKATHK